MATVESDFLGPISRSDRVGCGVTVCMIVSTRPDAYRYSGVSTYVVVDMGAE